MPLIVTKLARHLKKDILSYRAAAYLKLKEYKETTDRPVWDYMAHYAASGGYMVSMAADRIYANPNTVTGSIGVIMSGYDLTGLYEKLGIRYVSITSGENKDSSQLTDEQIAIYQTQVDEYYNKFIGIVSEGRSMSEMMSKRWRMDVLIRLNRRRKMD